MSTIRRDYNALQEIYVGTTKAFSPTIIDPDTGKPKDLRNSTIYNTARFRVLDPQYKEIGQPVSVAFINRQLGLIQYVIPDTMTVDENAGNWIGNIEFINIDGEIIDQQLVNFNILEN